VEITDPSVLQPHFTVQRTLLTSGGTSETIQTVIFDKNLAYVEIKNGQLKVNGQVMRLNTVLGIPTYSLTSPSVNVNTPYTFEIVLPDGNSYSGTVTTAAKTFVSLSAPATSNAQSDLEISWQEIYLHDEMEISLIFTTATGTVTGPVIPLAQDQVMDGSFTIPKSNFATPTGITSVLITLTGKENGTTDPKFRNGSEAKALISIQKSVEFN
jgi:hypothetical protein